MKLLLGVTAALLLFGCGLSGSGTGDDDVAKVDLDIRGLAVTQVTDTSAVLGWQTTDDAVGSVLYGTNQTLLGSNVRSSLARDHSVDLMPLLSDTDYWYQVSASTPLGESVTSELLSFRTTVSSDLADTTAPRLSNIRVEGITSSSATIRWDTDDRTNGLLRWGPSAFYGNETPEAPGSYSRNHSVILTDLLDDAEYHFQIEARNRNSLPAISDDQSFRTTVLPSLRITPAEIRVTANQTFDFFIECEGVTDLAGLEFTIVYSPSDMLEILEVREGAFFSQGTEGFMFIKKEPGPSQNPIQYEATWEIQYDGGIAMGTLADGAGPIARIRARARSGFDEIAIGIDTGDGPDGKALTRMLDHNRETISFKTDPMAVVKGIGGQ